MGAHFVRKLAFNILGVKDGMTAYGDRPFPTLPLRDGDPWFVPRVMPGIDLADNGTRGTGAEAE
jgi:hypothetical protein